MKILIVILFVIFITATSSTPAVEPYTADTSDADILADIHTDLVAVDSRATTVHITPHTSSTYTLNKKYIYLCLRDPDTGAYYDRHMLFHAALHELAHVINDEIGHTPKFHQLFGELRDRATRLGLYDPSRTLPAMYCSVEN